MQTTTTKTTTSKTNNRALETMICAPLSSSCRNRNTTCSTLTSSRSFVCLRTPVDYRIKLPSSKYKNKNGFASACLHENICGRRQGPKLFSRTRTIWVKRGFLPPHQDRRQQQQRADKGCYWEKSLGDMMHPQSDDDDPNKQIFHDATHTVLWEWEASAKYPGFTNRKWEIQNEMTRRDLAVEKVNLLVCWCAERGRKREPQDLPLRRCVSVWGNAGIARIGLTSMTPLHRRAESKRLPKQWRPTPFLPSHRDDWYQRRRYHPSLQRRDFQLSVVDKEANKNIPIT